MNSNEVRQSFIDYFSVREHEVVPSAPLVPVNDPSLLFTNAGMVQFKEVILGEKQRQQPCAVSVQGCLRAGGKHNDLENVGHTARHHTFFEMLGNFSFGDYFKEKAIAYAWEYLTDILKLPAQRLWVTVYEEDDEAAKLWLDSIGIQPERFSRCGEADNFWSMGAVGPCGPCSEIYYDHGEEIAGAPPGSGDDSGERFVEIWNLVFTQFNRDADGNLTPIPRFAVDTGMGLERIVAVLEGMHNNYDTSLFQPLIKAIPATITSDNISSARVIADHIRTIALLLAEGVRPGNEGRSYVLRRIIRRAIRHGRKLGLHQAFLTTLLSPLEQQLGEYYPLLRERQTLIGQALLAEEERFEKTLDEGLKRIAELIATATDGIIAGEAAFKLYDTYGFPLDLTADIAREHGLQVDENGFNTAMAVQRKRARSANPFTTRQPMSQVDIPPPADDSSFTGHTRLAQETEVINIYQEGNPVEELQIGEYAVVILRKTPFYAEAGGQIGDRGALLGSNDCYFEVADTQKKWQHHVHCGVLRSGTLRSGDMVTAQVDATRRIRIMRNHSATHLLHAALRQVIGEQVEQKGSLVAEERLRFDFSCEQALTQEQLRSIETLVNEQILGNADTVIETMSLEDARNSGALMLFGEKYEDEVRVLSIGGSFSKELCGGTHVSRCGDIGLFRIVSEGSVAAGIRRIEAVSGDTALSAMYAREDILKNAATLLKTEPPQLEQRLQQSLQKSRQLEKELERQRVLLAQQTSANLLPKAKQIGDIQVLAEYLEDADVPTLRVLVNTLKDKLGSAAVVLACSNAEKKIQLVAAVTSTSSTHIKAGEMINFVAKQVGGSGGGRADFAQAAGNDMQKLPTALESVYGWIEQQNAAHS